MAFSRSFLMIGVVTFALNGVGAQNPSLPPSNGDSAVTADTSEAAAAVTRFIDLDELGFDNGLELAGLTGSHDLFFRVPSSSAIESLSLRLPFRSDSAFESRRSLTIEVGDTPLVSRSLPNGAFEDVIDLPIDPALVENGFLKIRLRYAGAITEDRCIDQRISGAFLLLDKSGGLTARLKGAAVNQVNKVAAIMPSRAEIVLPANASEAQAAAALTLALSQAGARIVSAPTAGSSDLWNTARISFATRQNAAITANWASGQPNLVIGGEDPAGAARLLRTQWRAAISAPAAGKAVSERSAPKASVTLADLGNDTGVQSISERGAWNSIIPLAALPADMKPDGAVIETVVGADSGATAPVINVLLNGLLLDSAEANLDELTRLDVDFPEGSLASINDLEVSVTRQVASGDCRFEPQGYPAQLLPSSHLKLGDAGDVADFSDLPSRFNGGFTVVAKNAAQVAAAAPLLTALASGETKVSVSYGEAPTSGPSVVISDTQPAGSDPSIRFDDGPVELRNAQGASMLSSDALGEATIAQIVGSDAAPVLWLRPGSNFASLAQADPGDVTLSYGNVALIGSEQIDLSFSTTRDRLIDIRYPESFSFGAFLSEYRLWFIGLGWLLLSIGFIYILRKVYASRQQKG